MAIIFDFLALGLKHTSSCCLASYPINFQSTYFQLSELFELYLSVLKVEKIKELHN